MKQTIASRLPSGVKSAGATKAAAKLFSQVAEGATRIRSGARGSAFTGAWGSRAGLPEATGASRLPTDEPVSTNPLEAFFEARTVGRGIFKWRHYFEIYDRHLAKFVGEQTTLLEIGIYGGGSLDMWREYLGPGCDLYGVDIDPDCEKLEDATVFIGDQADRAFWQRFRAKTPLFDIIIDDGGHTSRQQRVTVEELLPRLRPGGAYICEDVHGGRNAFLAYVHGLSRGLFDYDPELDDANPERQMSSSATPFQSAVHSVHLYPYLVVVERRRAQVDEFVASKHGTEWPDS